MGEAAGEAFTPAVCDASGSSLVGWVLGTAEAMVYWNGAYMPISEYVPAGLAAKFETTFFRAYSISDSLYASGIGHEELIGNQKKYLDKQCVVVPLKAFQIFDPATGANLGVQNTSDDQLMTECVAFYTQTLK